MEYKLIIDKSLIDEYAEYYFKQHPRARKKPIEKPFHENLNQLLILGRMQMNAIKGRWMDFGKWWIRKLGYENLKLDKFEVEVKIYKDTARAFDLDNCIQKGIFDSFTESGFIIDDNYKHLTKLTTFGAVDREWPRTEIIIKVLEEESKN